MSGQRNTAISWNHTHQVEEEEGANHEDQRTRIRSTDTPAPPQDAAGANPDLMAVLNSFQTMVTTLVQSQREDRQQQEQRYKDLIMQGKKPVAKRMKKIRKPRTLTTPTHDVQPVPVPS